MGIDLLHWRMQSSNFSTVNNIWFHLLNGWLGLGWQCLPGAKRLEKNYKSYSHCKLNKKVFFVFFFYWYQFKKNNKRTEKPHFLATSYNRVYTKCNLPTKQLSMTEQILKLLTAKSSNYINHITIILSLANSTTDWQKTKHALHDNQLFRIAT